ncbi:MAG: ThuA domain-containing protein [Bryobacteraceae bacterium]|nr:ThuA domain-containing protein [Bryobacteraceae bacterium]
MIRRIALFSLLSAAGLAVWFAVAPPTAAQAQAPPPPRKKRLLAIGQVKGFQHDALSDAMGYMWKMGKESGLWDTYIRTDTQLLTKKKLTGNAKNIDYFDAVYFYTTGELDLDDEQKAALISFVKEDGKGFIGGHTAIDTNYKWPEYGEMVGGYFDRHPWNTFMAPVIVEDRDHPIMRHFPKEFTILDEIYQARNQDRKNVRVLARLDETKLDMKNPNIRRTDGDFAVAWVKTYGNGRVFYSTFGHHDKSLDRPDVQKMFFEATRWAMKLVDGDATPRPRPAN